jgi:hypothetical protein
VRLLSEVEAGQHNTWIIPGGKTDLKKLVKAFLAETTPKFQPWRSTRCSRWPKWGAVGCEPFKEAQYYLDNYFTGYDDQRLQRKLRINSSEFDAVVQKYWRA